MQKEHVSLLELGNMMREVIRVSKKRFEEQLHEDIKISTEQLGLLHAISIKEEDVIQKDMAEVMGKDKSAILRLIDSLEEKELVRRVADLKDRRKNYLMVTKLGQRVIDQYMKVYFDLMGELQEGLTPSEIDTFHKVINHIKDAASRR
ncbi:MAG TPA: MarR family transcriptional regulator [Prolixibacteraceae bacterium]|nr:MarR family transcriptional regulator [Prolixibacteraceae bacterium]